MIELKSVAALGQRNQVAPRLLWPEKLIGIVKESIRAWH